MLGERRVLVYGVDLIKAFSALQIILESCSFYFSLSYQLFICLQERPIKRN